MSDILSSFINKKSSLAKRWKEIIDEMVSDGRYAYAEETLVGIYEYIEENNDVTDAQIQAVKNIKDKPNNSYGYSTRF